MDDLTKLKMAFSLIVIGLYEKERQKKEGEYYYSKKLIHGINIFQSLNYKYIPKDLILTRCTNKVLLQIMLCNRYRNGLMGGKI